MRWLYVYFGDKPCFVCIHTIMGSKVLSSYNHKQNDILMQTMIDVPRYWQVCIILFKSILKLIDTCIFYITILLYSENHNPATSLWVRIWIIHIFHQSSKEELILIKVLPLILQGLLFALSKIVEFGKHLKYLLRLSFNPITDVCKTIVYRRYRIHCIAETTSDIPPLVSMK